MTITNLAGNKMLNGLTAAPKFVIRLHIGNPGVLGEENFAAENALKEFELSEAEESQRKNKAAIEWVGVKAKETYKFFTIWREITKAGNLYGSAEFKEPIAIEIGDTFKIPTGLLIVSVA